LRQCGDFPVLLAIAALFSLLVWLFFPHSRCIQRCPSVFTLFPKHSRRPGPHYDLLSTVFFSPSDPPSSRCVLKASVPLTLFIHGSAIPCVLPSPLPSSSLYSFRYVRPCFPLLSQAHSLAIPPVSFDWFFFPFASATTIPRDKSGFMCLLPQHEFVTPGYIRVCGCFG